MVALAVVCESTVAPVEADWTPVVMDDWTPMVIDCTPVETDDCTPVLTADWTPMASDDWTPDVLLVWIGVGLGVLASVVTGHATAFTACSQFGP